MLIADTVRCLGFTLTDPADAWVRYRLLSNLGDLEHVFKALHLKATFLAAAFCAGRRSLFLRGTKKKSGSENLTQPLIEGGQAPPYKPGMNDWSAEVWHARIRPRTHTWLPAAALPWCRWRILKLCWLHHGLRSRLCHNLGLRRRLRFWRHCASRTIDTPADP